MAGIIKAVNQAHLPGYSGMLKVHYTGSVERAQLPESVLSGLAYTYGTSRSRFYVDARDIGRVLAWTENGRQVFFVGAHKVRVNDASKGNGDDRLEAHQAAKDEGGHLPAEDAQRIPEGGQ
jgi:hypothetical protein